MTFKLRDSKKDFHKVMGWTKKVLKKKMKADSFWKKYSQPFKKAPLTVFNSRGAIK